MKTKLNDIFVEIAISDYDGIILTETWLTPDILNNEFIDHRYYIARCDRYNISNNDQRGGGVMIAVKKEFVLKDFQLSSLYENVWVNIYHKKRIVFIIGAIYLCPSTTKEVYELFIHDAEKLLFGNPEVQFMILGDFNRPNINWQLTDFWDGFGYIDTIFLDFIHFTNSRQINNIKNSIDRTLDLVLVSDQESFRVSESITPLAHVDPYHPPLNIFSTLHLHHIKRKRGGILRFPDSSSNIIETRGEFWNYRLADFLGIYEDLSEIDWNTVLNTMDVDINLINFYQTLNNILSVHVPRKNKGKGKQTVNSSKKELSYNTNYHIWLTDITRQLIKDKNKLHKIYKINPTEENYASFAEARFRAKYYAKNDYVKYIENIERELVSDPRKFFTFFKYKEISQTFPEEMCWNQKTYKGFYEIVEGFASYFGSVYGEEEMEHPFDLFDGFYGSFSCFGIEEIDEDEILLAIKSLKNTKAMGMDDIPTYLIKGCASLLLQPLKSIFNLSMSTGVFPKLWKMGKVVPIYKNQGARNDMTNYRPITIINVFSKILESIVHKRLYFNIKSKISDFQHGCIPKRNIITNLLSFTSFVDNILDHGGQVDTFFSDFAKAFDKVNFVLLIIKLMKMGCNRILALWFFSFLTNRILCVKLQNLFSSSFSNSTGIPQGSILGGLLFNIFVNDAGDVLKFSFFQIYVDDFKFYRCINVLEDCTFLQKDIDALFSWSLANKLPLNFSKCKVVSFTNKKHPVSYKYMILNTVVSSQDNIKDLGVYFDRSLTYKYHIHTTVKKAYRLSGFILRKSLHLKNLVTYFTLFNSLVRPIVEYASIIWSPSQSLWIKYIERVQTRFLRNVFFRMYNSIDCHDHHFNHYYFSSMNLRQLFSVPELALRRNVQCLTFFKKLICGNFDCTELLASLNFSGKSGRLRHFSLFYPPQVRTSHAKNSAIYRFCYFFNLLANEVDLFGTSVEHFQRLCFIKLQNCEFFS